MCDNECRGGNEEIIHSVELLSHWLSMDGVMRHVPAGLRDHLDRTHFLELRDSTETTVNSTAILQRGAMSHKLHY